MLAIDTIPANYFANIYANSSHISTIKTITPSILSSVVIYAAILVLFSEAKITTLAVLDKLSSDFTNAMTSAYGISVSFVTT